MALAEGRDFAVLVHRVSQEKPFSRAKVRDVNSELKRASVQICTLWLIVVNGQNVVKAEVTDQNLARLRPYECVTPPNYWGWKNPVPGDKGQLTDGRTLGSWTDSKGKPFYSLKSVDGWAAINPVVIVFDLGEVCSIGEVGLHSVLFPWGPWWPEAVSVLISDDNKDFFLAASTDLNFGNGCLTIPKIIPPVSEQTVRSAIDRTFEEKGSLPTMHWFRVQKIGARGRYVSLIMRPSTSTGTIVLDEIEIYEGHHESFPNTRPIRSFRKGKGGWQSYLLAQSIGERLSRDIRALRLKVAKAPISEVLRKQLEVRLEQLDKERQVLPVPKAKTFSAVLPIDDLHREVFKVQAALWRAQGFPFFRV